MDKKRDGGIKILSDNRQAGHLYFLSDREGPMTLFRYDPATRQVICHWHAQLSDPIYRRFTGEFLIERRTLKDPKVELVPHAVTELTPTGARDAGGESCHRASSSSSSERSPSRATTTTLSPWAVVAIARTTQTIPSVLL